MCSVDVSPTGMQNEIRRWEYKFTERDKERGKEVWERVKDEDGGVHMVRTEYVALHVSSTHALT